MQEKDTLIAAWRSFQQGQDFQEYGVPDYIKFSWERSRKYGVNPFKEKADVLNSVELAERIDKNNIILETVIPPMKDLYNITKGAGFCTVVTDNEGYILKRIGNQNELDFTQYGNFIEGANWSEQVMGTNAVGLALVLDRPVQVYAYEHFCKCACLSTCSAAPIHNLNGDIIAVLDLTGPYKLVNSHTLGMVVAATKAIERTLELKKICQGVRESELHKKIILESIREGLFAIDGQGIITHINELARGFMELGETDCVGKRIQDLIDNDHFIKMIVSRRNICGESIQLKTKNGKRKFVINTTRLEINDSYKNGVVVVMHELQPINRIVNYMTGTRTNTRFENLIGNSNVFLKALEQARMAAETNSNVLLLGESGTGKDLFARAIHNASKRNRETFLPINCAAIPRDLISSELFGYEEGAFTGARAKGNSGKFELADNGTVFLDEIGETPLDLQTNLLRVLEDRTLIRLGGREVIPVDIRLICATNRNLKEEVRCGNFRADLFYRISVISIILPALRERKEDIPLMVESFIKNISDRLGKAIKGVDSEVLDILLKYDWPGNVRELHNVIERAINLVNNYEKITINSLPSEILERKLEPFYNGTPSKENLEEQLIRTYLSKFNNNKSEVAKALNISRSNLYRKIQKYGINTQRFLM